MRKSFVKTAWAAGTFCAVWLIVNGVSQAQVPYGAGYYDQSDYALGTYVWNIVFLETETNPWDAGVLDARKNRINTAATFWEDKANQPGRFLDGIDWLDINVNFANGGVPLVLDDVGAEGSSTFYDEALGLLDPSYDTGGPTSAARTYNAAMREQFGTNWSFTTFVRNFSGRASAFINGPYTNAYSDDPSGTYAHEVGHIFGALDEYNGASNTGARSGYLYTYNTNSLNHPDGSTNENSHNSIMRSTGSTVLSEGTINAIGWRDQDADQVPDILDTFPTLSNLSVATPSVGTLSLEFDAVVSPLTSPSPGMGNYTVNTLASAEYRVNDGNWVALSPSGSSWGDYEVEMDFDITGLTEPVNDVEIRVYNSVTNYSTLEFMVSPNGELPGDANRDGITDQADLNIWSASHANATQASWNTGDFDLNGLLDGRDFLVWQQATGLEFLTEGSGMGSHPIGQRIAITPEPQSFILLGLGSMLLLSTKRSL